MSDAILLVVPYVSEEQRIADRIKKIELWLSFLDEAYEDLLSRPEETASLSGFHVRSETDPGPRVRPCECRSIWIRHKLCLACDNSGWRPAAEGEEGIDPYSAQVPKRASVLLIESDATKKLAQLARLDASIASLERNGLVRDGIEAPEDRELRAYRIVTGRKEHYRSLRRVLRGLRKLLMVVPDALSRPRRMLARALVHLVEGRLAPPPVYA